MTKTQKKVMFRGVVPTPEKRELRTSATPAVVPSAAPLSAVPTPEGQPPVKKAFVDPPSIATQIAPMGIRFDFNDGCRVTVPEGKWALRLKDLDTENVLFETNFAGGVVASSKKYFIRVGIEIEAEGKRVFNHQYNAKDRPVLIQFPVGTLGDLVGWFPYAVKFQEKHGCVLTCAMASSLIALFAPCYPQIRFVTPEEVKPEDYYATYRIGLFFTDPGYINQPADFQMVGLHRTAGHILGVDPSEVPPKLHIENDTRPIPEPYICIAAQASTQCKYWNNPTGWRELVAFLKENGYRVICIDQKATHGTKLVWNHIPYGAEDQTGDIPLNERARWLKYADFFVGLSSGLSWLAWAAGTPVVMISGFTNPYTEFETPHRVINYHTCNSCWNDVRERFDHHDFFYCPRHAGTPRQFECTRLITSGQVAQVIRRIDGFGAVKTAKNA